MTARLRIVLAAWGVVGFLLVLAANRGDRLPGVHADSLSYLEAGRALADTGALTTPFVDWSDPGHSALLTHFPPGFSVALGLMTKAGAQPLGAAVLVMAVAAGILLLLASLLGHSVHGWAGAVIVPLVLATVPEHARLYIAVWSEPLFLALCMGALVSGASGRWTRFGLLAGIATLVRYAGLPLALAGAMVAMVSTRRWRSAAAAVSPSAIAFLGWSLTARISGGAVRTYGLYLEGFGVEVAGVGQVLAAWFWPGGGGGSGAVLATLVVGLGAAFLFRHREGRSSSALVMQASWVFAAAYAAFIGTSRLFADPQIPLDSRLLAPLCLSVLVALSLGLAAEWERGGRRHRVAVFLFLLAFTGRGVWIIRSGVAGAGSSGLFYTSTYWDGAPPLQWARDAREDGVTVYSNEPELLFFRSGMQARRLPRAGDPVPSTELRTLLSQPGTAVVLVPPFRQGELGVEELSELGGLHVLVQSSRGFVLISADEP